MDDKVRKQFEGVNEQLKEYGLKIVGDKVVEVGSAYCIYCEGYSPLVGFVFVEEHEKVSSELCTFFQETFPKDSNEVIARKLEKCWMFKMGYRLAKVIKEMKITEGHTLVEEEHLNQLLFDTCETVKEGVNEKVSTWILKNTIKEALDNIEEI